MRIAVTGCAGLIGSHLTAALLARGDAVVGVDDYSTGRRANVERMQVLDAFRFVDGDVCEPTTWAQVGPVDAVVQLASPASPVDFATIPDAILRAGSIGTLMGVDHAVGCGARYIQASTSEVYGEPLEHPQTETYRGNVSTTGPRACYDESKRFAEAVVTTTTRSSGLDGAIARIFNTYGPGMRLDDGRVIPAFVMQALRGEPLTVNGDGSQTRSFCFVDDQVRGLIALLDSVHAGPFNLGNPVELRVIDVARLVIELTGSSSSVRHLPMPLDDPSRRRPDIQAARLALSWEPVVDLRAGLAAVIEDFSSRLALT